MRKSLLMSAAAVALTFGAPAFVQTAMAQTGYNAGLNVVPTHKYSAQASNINSSDIRSRIAPVLPTPAGASQNSSPEQLLGIAQNELQRGQTGAAQQALEMAMTNALNDVNGVVSPSMAGTPSSNPLVGKINQALQALGRHDTAGAQQAIQEAMAGGRGMTNAGMGTQAMPGGTMNSGMGAPPPPPPPQ